MDTNQLGNTPLRVTPIGFGAFKIGRNTGVKYPHSYPLPNERAVDTLLNTVLDLGINLIDTAPAYGVSEERIGHAIAHRRGEYVLSSKVGERYDDGKSTYDYSRAAVLDSVTRSLKRLRTDALDLLLIHSDGRDLHILDNTDIVPTLIELRDRGLTRAIGLSGKTPEGARAALAWADAVMVEHHSDDRSHEPVIAEAAHAGVGVLVKKGLASGRLDPRESIRFALSNPAVTSMVIGGLNADHLRDNIRTAEETLGHPPHTA